MKKLILVLFVLSLLACQRSHAEMSPELQYNHDWNHIGMSFAVHTTVYQFSRKVMQFNRWEATAFSFIATTMITTMYSMGGADRNSSDEFPRTMLMNGAGTLLSTGVNLTFDF